MNIYTIGYEGTTVEALLNELDRHFVQTLIDVRYVPLSRKAGFSKNALANLLDVRGIEYRHVKSLGCPSIIRDRYKEDGDWGAYTQSFKQYLDTQEEAVEELLPLVERFNCCLLCFERDPNFCHRKYVAERLVERSAAPLSMVSLYARTARRASKPAVDLRTAPLWPGLALP
mgnify:CR=1 FL=1